jgi:hypothetical protein
MAEDMGFETLDFACCKVVKHSLWGARAIFFAVFTNAPSSLVQSLSKSVAF